MNSVLLENKSWQEGCLRGVWLHMYIVKQEPDKCKTSVGTNVSRVTNVTILAAFL